MMKHKHCGLAALLFAVGLLGMAGDSGLRRANAQDTRNPKVESIAVEPPGLFDSAFAKFVNARSLAPAIEKHNTTWLTDLAFQFALAESVLERQHKLFSAKEVAAIAVAAAAETQDKDSLDRLAKLATKLSDKDLAAKVAAAKLESSKTRAPAPPVMVSADTVNPSTIAAYKEFCRVIRTEKILGNRADIERRVTAFKKQKDMPKELLDRGVLLANAAVTAIPKDAKLSSAAIALQQLLDFRERLRMESLRK
jgi:hypothetical protein